jgi:O-acetyl-ADP-ribose deacetylase (regulator of RNase III)
MHHAGHASDMLLRSCLIVSRSDRLQWKLEKSCKAIVRMSGRCPTGETRLTRGYDLPAKYILHTVGPMVRVATHGASLREFVRATDFSS